MNKVGFMGLGSMGEPMARNIGSAGIELMVYNRTPGKDQALLRTGAKVAQRPEEVFEWAETVVMMLSGPSAIEDTLGGLLRELPELLAGKTVVNMGTNPPSYAVALSERLHRVGASFVDAPVLGTKVPAEEGNLVVVASGEPQAVESLKPVFEAVGKVVINCGEVPKASTMKLAVNLVLSAAVGGLIEGTHFARKAGLDLQTFFGLIMASPLGNDIFGLKAQKLMKEDYAPQAAIRSVREMLKHVVDTAYEMDASVPGAQTFLNLATMAVNLGLAEEDACALIKVYDAQR